MIHLKSFNITIGIISAVAILAMICSFPFTKRMEKLTDIPELSSIPQYAININSADERELALLKGLGEKTARAIVDYRSKKGAFESIDALDDVYGIGDKKISAWSEFITVGN